MDDVAILLATYNGEKYLRELLESLIAQSFNNWTCYIHDDNSNDKTINILNEYVEEYPQKFYLLNYDVAGKSSSNFISLLKRTNSKYTMFCDQDDVWLPNKIESTLRRMKQVEEMDKPTLVFTDLTVVDCHLRVIDDSYISYTKRDPQNLSLQNLLKQNLAAGCTIMINNALLSIAKDNIELLQLAMHDWGLILLACVKGKISYLNESTILYRQHNNNQVGATRKSLTERMKDFFTGKKISAIKYSVELEKSFILLLFNVVKPGERYFTFINSFKSNTAESKVQRIIFYIKNGLVSLQNVHLFRVLFV